MSKETTTGAAEARGLATVIPFPTRPWWHSAPNPDCVDWCELEHPADEFADGAALRCMRTIVDDHRFTVRAESLVAAHADGRPDALGEELAGAFVEVHVNELEAADAAELVAAIREASVTCERPARAAVGSRA